MAQASSLEILFIYNNKDKKLFDKLSTSLRGSLAYLENNGLVRFWDTSMITAGAVPSQVFDSHLQSARVILLLISSDFMASDFPFSPKMKKLMEKHNAGETHIIPILLRSTLWSKTPFSALKPLPTNRKFVSSWKDEDEALLDIAKGVAQIVESLLPSENQSDNTGNLLTDDANGSTPHTGAEKNQQPAQAGLTSIQVQFLKEKQTELQESFNELSKHIKVLKQALDSETHPPNRILFENNLKQKQTAREEVVAELAEIERQLS